jgi:aspartate 1-decarboxylase
MQVLLLKSKIHRATVTAAELDYQGSLAIDAELMEQAGLLPYEKILCANLTNGHRFETYAIPAPRGSRQIVLNGATAHLGNRGDELIIMSFASVDTAQAKAWRPQVLVLGPNNTILTKGSLE